MQMRNMNILSLKARELLLLLPLASLVAITQGLSDPKECKSEAFPPIDQFLVEGNVNYLKPNDTQEVGYLVIVPEMRFNCYGNITSWSALVQFRSREDAINHLRHDITFQLWRPSSRENGVFSFIGSQTVSFVANGLRENLIFVNGIQYLNFTSAQPRDTASGDMLLVQPGDIVGWYIHTLFQSVQVPLTVAYRQLSPEGVTGDPGVEPVNMYTKTIADTSKASTLPPCQVSLCSDKFAVISSVVPYVTVDIELSSSTISTLPETQSEAGGPDRCVNTMTDITSPVPTTNMDKGFCNPPETTDYATNPLSTNTPPIKPSTDSSRSIALTTGIVGSLILIALVFNIIIVFLIVYCNRRINGEHLSAAGTEPENPRAGQGNIYSLMGNEPRYSPHSDVIAMPSEAYTTDINTKSNEAYGTSGGHGV